jgi:hypothetical protein
MSLTGRVLKDPKIKAWCVATKDYKDINEEQVEVDSFKPE